MSGYFGVLMRSSGVSADAPAARRADTSPPLDPDIEASTTANVQAPINLSAATVPSAPATASPLEPQPLDAETPAPSRPAEADAVLAPRDRPVPRTDVAAPAAPPANTSKQAPPAAQPSQPVADATQSSEDLSREMLRLALKWVAQGRVPDSETAPVVADVTVPSARADDPMDIRPSAADSSADWLNPAQPPLQSNATTVVARPAEPVESRLTAFAQPAWRPDPVDAMERPITPARMIEPEAVRFSAASPRRRSDEPVEVHIGSIHLRVDAPSAATVTRPAAVAAAASAPTRSSRRSALSRRALRRI